MPMTSPTGPGSETRSRRRAPGFTLFELILVMAVLALIAAAVTPALTRFARGRRSTDAAGHFLAVIQYAQERAVQTASPHRVEVDAQGGTYRVSVRRGGVVEALRNEYGRTFNLPESTTIEWVDSAAAAQRGYVQFDPDGRHDVALWRIGDAEGASALVGCPSPAEPFRVASDSAAKGGPR